MEIKYPNCLFCKYAGSISEIFDGNDCSLDICINCEYPIPSEIKLPFSMSKLPVTVGVNDLDTNQRTLSPEEINCPCYKFDKEHMKELLKRNFPDGTYKIV